MENGKLGHRCSDVFLPEKDDVFEIGLTPNRADAMSHMGVARDLKQLGPIVVFKLKLITPSVNDFHVQQSLIPFVLMF